MTPKEAIQRGIDYAEDAYLEQSRAVRESERYPSRIAKERARLESIAQDIAAMKAAKRAT